MERGGSPPGTWRVWGKLFEAFSSGVPVEVPASYTMTCASKT